MRGRVVPGDELGQCLAVLLKADERRAIPRPADRLLVLSPTTCATLAASAAARRPQHSLKGFASQSEMSRKTRSTGFSFGLRPRATRCRIISSSRMPPRRGARSSSKPPSIVIACLCTAMTRPSRVGRAVIPSLIGHAIAVETGFGAGEWLRAESQYARGLRPSQQSLPTGRARDASPSAVRSASPASCSTTDALMSRPRATPSDPESRRVAAPHL